MTVTNHPPFKMTIYDAGGMNGNSPVSVTTIGPENRRKYLHPEKSRDVFAVILFIGAMIAYVLLILNGVCVAAQTSEDPIVKVSVKSVVIKGLNLGKIGLAGKFVDLITALTIVMGTIIVSGMVTLGIMAFVYLRPKYLFTGLIRLAPLFYMSIALISFYYMYSFWSILLYSALAIVHLIYLAFRTKHLHLYRIVIKEAAKIGSALDRFLLPLALWIFALVICAISLVGMYGFAKMYLHRPYIADLSAILVIIFVTQWILNLLKNQYRMVIAGTIVNQLITPPVISRSSSDQTTEKVDHPTRGDLTKLVLTKLFGPAAYAAFILAIMECVILVLIIVNYRSIHLYVRALAVAISLHHLFTFFFKQTGLIHVIMFGSSFMDGTFDVYHPILFYDDLINHILSIITLLGAIIGGVNSYHLTLVVKSGTLGREGAMLFATFGAYLSLFTNDLLVEFLRTSVATHIVCFGENPILMSKTSPHFTDAVKAAQISDVLDDINEEDDSSQKSPAPA